MGIGYGGADVQNSPFVPIAPLDGDTGLYKPLANPQNGIASLAAAPTIDFTGTNPRATFVSIFDCSVVNSMVNECVLMFNDQKTIFARYTFKTMSLQADSNFSLQVTWTIEF